MIGYPILLSGFCLLFCRSLRRISGGLPPLFDVDERMWLWREREMHREEDKDHGT